MPKIKIAPSILLADHNSLNEQIRKVEPYSDIIHVDIMDGKFVPPTTFSVQQIKALKTKLPLEAHLMVKNPEDHYIDDYSFCDIIIIHEESTKNFQGAIDKIKSLGCKVGITIRPSTNLEKLMPYIDQANMVLIMSVEPGYAGQKFIPSVIEKIKKIRKIKPKIDIEIDGGINKETLPLAKEAGVNVFVAASAIFSQPDSVKAVKELRKIAIGCQGQQ